MANLKLSYKAILEQSCVALLYPSSSTPDMSYKALLNLSYVAPSKLSYKALLKLSYVAPSKLSYKALLE